MNGIMLLQLMALHRCGLALIGYTDTE